VLATPGHENRAYNITGPDAVGPRDLVALASEISGKKVELVVLDEAAYRKHLLDTGVPEESVPRSLAFDAELNSPFLREPSKAVAELTGKPPTSVRALLLASKSRLRAAAKR
jgi:NAD(P)H dehydrogenase (quinone)